MRGVHCWWSIGCWHRPFTDTAEEDAVDICDEDTCDEDEDQSDTDSEYSFDAPPFSPINETCEEGDTANVESLEISEDVLLNSFIMMNRLNSSSSKASQPGQDSNLLVTTWIKYPPFI